MGVLLLILTFLQRLTLSRYSQFIEMFGNPLSQNQKYPIRLLGEICIVNPKKEKLSISDETMVSFVPMAAVHEDGFIQERTDRPYGEVKKGFTYFANNDVLFAKITPCMENGKGALAQDLTNGIGMGSTEFHILRPKEGVSTPNWLLTLTRMGSFRYEASKNMSGTGGQRRVNASFLENFPIGLPPKALQEEFTAFVRQADKSEFDGFKSQFIEMFGTLNQNIPWSEVVTITNGKAYPGEYKSAGTYPICGSGGIMHYGDLKLCERNTTILGRKGNINSPIFMESEYWIVDTAFSLDVNKELLDPVFFYHWCRHYDFTRHNKQGVLPSLTRKDLEKIQMAVPPMEQQKRFVSFSRQADKSESLQLKVA